MAIFKTGNKTWQDGDTVQYYPEREELPIVPGLFFYSGFGMGNLFRPDHTVIWCSTSTAREICQTDNIEMIFRDSFALFILHLHQ